MKSFAVFSLLLFSLLFGGAADAATNGFPSSSSGNKTTFTGAAMNARFADKFVWDVGVDGKLYATSAGEMNLNGGKSIPVSATAKLTGATLGALAFKVASKYAGPIGMGWSLYQLAKEIDWNLTAGPNGEVVASSGGGTTPFEAWACYPTWGPPDVSQSSLSGAADACAARAQNWIRATYPSHATCVVTVTSISTAPQGANLNFSGPSGCSGTPFYDIGGGAPNATPVPQTLQQFADAIAAQSGWPSGSAISNVVRDAAAADVPFDVPAPTTITGPATSPGSVVTVTNNAGDVTTTTTTNNHSYAGNVVTTNTTTVVSVTNVSTGATTTTSTTTAEASPPEGECEKNPNTVGCSQYGTPAAQTLPVTDSGFSAISPVSFSGGSGCPSDLTFSILGHSYAISYTGACASLDTYIKPIILLLASAVAAFVFVKGFQV